MARNGPQISSTVSLRLLRLACLAAGMSTAEQVALFKYLEDFQIQSNAARRINSRAMERFAGEIQSQLTACILASKHNLLSLNFLSKPFCRAVLTTEEQVLSRHLPSHPNVKLYEHPWTFGPHKQ